MKIIRIIGHPYLIIGLFLIIMISGRSIGGVYLFYLLLALPHFGIHSMLAIGGIAMLAIINTRSLFRLTRSVEKLFGIVGVVCLVLSLLSFFYNDKSYYNYGSFSSIAFWITAGCFLVSCFCYILNLTGFYSYMHNSDSISLKK